MTTEPPDGTCEHDVILNGACFYCGTTELDGVLASPKPADEFIPASRLSRGPTGQASPASRLRPTQPDKRDEDHSDRLDDARDDRE